MEQSARESAVAQIDAARASGSSVKDACAEFGMSPVEYYRAKKTSRAKTVPSGAAAPLENSPNNIPIRSGRRVVGVMLIGDATAVANSFGVFLRENVGI